MGRVSDAKERLMESVEELIWKGSYGSTTIDQICEKAGVNKGTFYYFFNSKADLALAAIEAKWQQKRRELDSIFLSTVPPLERLRKYCEASYRIQADIKAKCGYVLGCPLFSLATEVSTQERPLQKKIQQIFDQQHDYFESAIHDAHEAGLIHAPNTKLKSKVLFAYFYGLVTEARIRNSLETLREAQQGMWELLGVKELEVITK